MIYTASYFEPHHHHGELISISRSNPKNVQVVTQLPFLAPSSELLQDWKRGNVDEADYTARFREEIKDRWPTVHQWMESLKPDEDSTLLCWERAGEFCHRNLVLQMLLKYRPDCVGGADVAIMPSRVEPMKCPKCYSEVLPGLDYCYCHRCNAWIGLEQTY
jgi:uncharacterized protein YeaO (DUF488 family)